MRFLIVTGLSGAGKTTVLRHLEDIGYQCMDNLPPVLLEQAFHLCQTLQPDRRVALGVDSRSGALFDANAVLKAVARSGDRREVALLFLDADTESLIDRYKETRRDHPLSRSGTTLEQSIQGEREILQPLRECADFVLSTTGLSARALCEQVDMLIASGSSRRLHAEILSFGFKRGVPRESDLVFDVRFLPNPYYIRGIRSYTGLQAPVRDYLLGLQETQDFLRRLYDMVDFLLPLYQREGKRRLMIAVGCTGGAHRSVVVAEALRAHMLALGCPVGILHRDIEKEEAAWPFRNEHDRT